MMVGVDWTNSVDVVLVLPEVVDVEVGVALVGWCSGCRFGSGRLGKGWVGCRVWGGVGRPVGLGVGVDCRLGVDLGILCLVGKAIDVGSWLVGGLVSVGSRFGVDLGLGLVGSLMGFRLASVDVMSTAVLGLDLESSNFFKCNVLGVRGVLLLSASFLLGC